MSAVCRLRLGRESVWPASVRASNARSKRKRVDARRVVEHQLSVKNQTRLLNISRGMRGAQVFCQLLARCDAQLGASLS